MKNEVRDLVNSISGIEGVEIVQGGNGHLRVHYKQRLVTTLPATPSDHRWRQNALAELRRYGLTPAVKNHKKARETHVRPLLPVGEIRGRVGRLSETRGARYEFAQFVIDYAAATGLRPPYRNVKAAAGSLSHFVSGGGLHPKSHEALDSALRAWDSVQSQKHVAEVREEAAPEPQVPLAEHPEDACVTLRISLSSLSAALERFGVTIEIDQ